jgi:hypothetical protein
MNDPSTLPLVLVNVILGIGCVGCLVAVGIAVVLDVAERRRWRRSIPKGWPPDAPRARHIATLLPRGRSARRTEARA